MHTQYDADDLREACPKDQGVPLTSAILSYEVGDFIKCALNEHWGRSRGYHGEAKLALADVITMTRLLAAHLYIDFWEAMRIGEDRYIEAVSIKETRDALQKSQKLASQ